MDINTILAKSKEIALDSPPSGGSEYTEAIYQIFQDNPGKVFSGKDIKKVFAAQNVAVDNASSVLYTLAKQEKLERVQTGWYRLTK